MVLYKRGFRVRALSCESIEVLADTSDGDQLYTGVKKLVAEHLDQLAEERIVPAFPRAGGSHVAGALGGGAQAVEQAVEGDRFLRSVKSVWDDHTGSMRKLKDILKYMVGRETLDCIR